MIALESPVVDVEALCYMRLMPKIATVSLVLLAAALPLSAAAEGKPKPVQKPKVEMVTNVGKIVIELNPGASPKTVENFLKYVDDKFYDGTIFHRVIRRFMIQGGGFTKAMEKKDTRDPIQNEALNGLSNTRGTIAMARTNNPHSATAQFFINVVDNAFLDQQPSRWGYAVFGRVVKGMDVVDKIRMTPTGRKGPFGSDVPQTDVVIEKIRRIKG